MLNAPNNWENPQVTSENHALSSPRLFLPCKTKEDAAKGSREYGSDFIKCSGKWHF